MGTCLGEMQRNCSQTKAKPVASWCGRARVNQATSSSQFSPMRRNMRTWTARPRSPTSWSATRWDNSVQATWTIQKLKLMRRILWMNTTWRRCLPEWLAEFITQATSAYGFRTLLTPPVVAVVELLIFVSSRMVNTMWVAVRGSTHWLTWWITTRRTPWWRKVAS